MGLVGSRVGADVGIKQVQLYLKLESNVRALLRAAGLGAGRADGTNIRALVVPVSEHIVDGIPPPKLF